MLSSKSNHKGSRDQKDINKEQKTSALREEDLLEIEDSPPRSDSFGQNHYQSLPSNENGHYQTPFKAPGHHEESEDSVIDTDELDRLLNGSHPRSQKQERKLFSSSSSQQDGSHDLSPNTVDRYLNDVSPDGEEKERRRNGHIFSTPRVRFDALASDKVQSPFKHRRMEALFPSVTEDTQPGTPYRRLHQQADETESKISVTALRPRSITLRDLKRKSVVLSLSDPDEKLTFLLDLWHAIEGFDAKAFDVIDPHSFNVALSETPLDALPPRFILDEQFRFLEASFNDSVNSLERENQHRIQAIFACAQAKKQTFLHVNDFLSYREDAETHSLKDALAESCPELLTTILMNAVEALVRDPKKTDIDRYYACLMVAQTLEEASLSEPFKGYMLQLMQKLQLLRNVLYICNVNKPYRDQAIAVLIEYVETNQAYEDISVFVLWYLLRTTELSQDERDYLGVYLKDKKHVSGYQGVDYIGQYLNDLNFFVEQTIYVNAAHAALLYDVLNPFFQEGVSEKHIEKELDAQPSLNMLIHIAHSHVETSHQAETLGEEKAAELHNAKLSHSFGKAIIERFFQFFIDEKISAYEVCQLLRGCIEQGKDTIINNLFLLFYTELTEDEQSDFNAIYNNLTTIERFTESSDALQLRSRIAMSMATVFLGKMMVVDRQSSFPNALIPLVRAYALFAYKTSLVLATTKVIAVFEKKIKNSCAGVPAFTQKPSDILGMNAQEFDTFMDSFVDFSNEWREIVALSKGTWDAAVQGFIEVQNDPFASQLERDQASKDRDIYTAVRNLHGYWRDYRALDSTLMKYLSLMLFTNQSLVNRLSEDQFYTVFTPVIEELKSGGRITLPSEPSNPILVQDGYYNARSTSHDAVLDFIANATAVILTPIKEYMPPLPADPDDREQTNIYQARLRNYFSFFGQKAIAFYEELISSNPKDVEFYAEAIERWNAFLNAPCSPRSSQALVLFSLKHSRLDMAFPFLKLLVCDDMWFEDITNEDKFYAYLSLGTISFHAGIHGTANKPGTRPFSYLIEALKVAAPNQERMVFRCVTDFVKVFSAVKSPATSPLALHNDEACFFTLSDFQAIKDNNQEAWRYLNTEFDKLNHEKLITAFDAFAVDDASFDHYLELGLHAHLHNQDPNEKGETKLALWALASARSQFQQDANFIKAIETLYHGVEKVKDIEWLTETIDSLNSDVSFDQTLWSLIAAGILFKIRFSDKEQLIALKHTLLALLSDECQEAFLSFYPMDDASDQKREEDHSALDHAKALQELLTPFTHDDRFASFWTSSHAEFVERLSGIFIDEASYQEQCDFFEFVNDLNKEVRGMDDILENSPERNVERLQVKINRALRDCPHDEKARYGVVLNQLNERLAIISNSDNTIGLQHVLSTLENIVALYEAAFCDQSHMHSSAVESTLMRLPSLFSSCLAVSDESFSSIPPSAQPGIRHGGEVYDLATFTDFCFVVGIDAAVSFLLAKREDEGQSENKEIIDYLRASTNTRLQMLNGINSNISLKNCSILYFIKYPVLQNEASLGYYYSQDTDIQRHFSRDGIRAFTPRHLRALPETFLSLFDNRFVDKEILQYAAQVFIKRLSKRVNDKKSRVCISAVELYFIACLFNKCDDENLYLRLQTLFEDGIFRRLSRLERKFSEEAFNPFNTDDAAVLIIALENMSLLTSPRSMDLVCQLCEMFLHSKYKNNIKAYPEKLKLPLSSSRFSQLYAQAKGYRFCAACVDYVQALSDIHAHAQALSEIKEYWYSSENADRLVPFVHRISHVFPDRMNDNALFDYFNMATQMLFSQRNTTIFSVQAAVIGFIRSLLEGFRALNDELPSVKRLCLNRLEDSLNTLVSDRRAFSVDKDTGMGIFVNSDYDSDSDSDDDEESPFRTTIPSAWFLMNDNIASRNRHPLYNNGVFSANRSDVSQTGPSPESKEDKDKRNSF